MELPNKSKKLGLFTLSMLTLGSMIGAGVFVVPNELRIYGTASTLGWLIASFCACTLAMVFSDLAVHNEGKSFTIATGESCLGKNSGFVSGLNQWLFLFLASIAVAFTLAKYLILILNVESDYLSFFIVSAISLITAVLHARTKAGLKLIEGITVLKLVVFFFVSILGIFSFKFNMVFGGLRLASGTLLHSVQAAAAAIFAFAGLDSAAAKSSDAKDPKRTIPIAITASTIGASIVYILTHVCVLSSGTLSQAPVSDAVSILAPPIFGNFSQLLNFLVSFIGTFGCLGTFLAVTFVCPTVLSDAVKIANPNFKTRTSRTGLPVYIIVLQTVVTIIAGYLKYLAKVDLSIIFNTSNFALVVFYFYSTILSLATRKKRLAIPGLIACSILLIGCNMQAVFLGSIFQMIGQVAFVMIARRIRNLK
jgi:amino acid transporter